MIGIDVSKWQGAIDWHSVKTHGNIDFAILKVTQKNNSIEGSFERNYTGCYANAIPVGVYRYVYATNTSQAREEAYGILRAINDKHITCGIWLDMEDASLSGLSKSTLNSIINTEAKILQDSGCKVGIYCNKNWYLNVLDSPYLSQKYPFWIARYPSKDVGVIVSSLSPISYAKMWQYSSKGSVAGIDGCVDMNISFVDLQDLMSTEMLAPPPVAVVDTDKYYPKYSGNSTSIVTALKMVGVDYSYTFRKKIAKANGIKLYVGASSQNTEMLKKLKNGLLIRA